MPDTTASDSCRRCCAGASTTTASGSRPRRRTLTVQRHLPARDGIVDYGGPGRGLCRFPTDTGRRVRLFGLTEFDRSKLRLSAWQSTDGLSISYQWPGRFVLLPIQHAQLAVAGGRGRLDSTSRMTRDTAIWTLRPISSPSAIIIARWAGASHDGNSDKMHSQSAPSRRSISFKTSRDAPFFYEDSRHVFFVTTDGKAGVDSRTMPATASWSVPEPGKWRRSRRWFFSSSEDTERRPKFFGRRRPGGPWSGRH